MRAFYRNKSTNRAASPASMSPVRSNFGGLLNRTTTRNCHGGPISRGSHGPEQLRSNAGRRRHGAAFDMPTSDYIEIDDLMLVPIAAETTMMARGRIFRFRTAGSPPTEA
ncbi:MAG: hypothetical protein R3D69_16880 [Xanthobacteraceae bacterium]